MYNMFQLISQAARGRERKTAQHLCRIICARHIKRPCQIGTSFVSEHISVFELALYIHVFDDDGSLQ